MAFRSVEAVAFWRYEGSAFKAIYGYAATEDDLDGVFRLAENAGAADYAQFKRR